MEFVRRIDLCLFLPAVNIFKTIIEEKLWLKVQMR
jgi:hypothetical protein